MSTMFDLHSSVLADYGDFVRSFILIADEQAQEFVEAALGEEGSREPGESPPLAARCSLARGILPIRTQ